MKSFNDFRKSLTQEDVDLIAKRANEATKDIDHSNGLQLGTVSGLVATITTMELLEKYHEWLQD